MNGSGICSNPASAAVPPIAFTPTSARSICFGFFESLSYAREKRVQKVLLICSQVDRLLDFKLKTLRYLKWMHIDKDDAMRLVLSAANVRGWTTGSVIEGPSVFAGAGAGAGAGVEYESSIEKISTFPWSLFTKAPRRFHDDMDLPCGVLRLQPKGGHESHNGMKSVIYHFYGNQEFPRLRIGIGKPPGQMDPSCFRSSMQQLKIDWARQD